MPDLTVVLDLDPELGLSRVPEAPDRIELESLEFHQRVRAGFLALAAETPGRYLVVSAEQSPEQVQQAVRVRLTTALARSASGAAVPA